jgi:hypothetical protein
MLVAGGSDWAATEGRATARTAPPTSAATTVATPAALLALLALLARIVLLHVRMRDHRQRRTDPQWFSRTSQERPVRAGRPVRYGLRTVQALLHHHGLPSASPEAARTPRQFPSSTMSARPRRS